MAGSVKKVTLSKAGPFRLSVGIIVFCLLMIAIVWAAVITRSDEERKSELADAERQNTNLAIAFEHYSLRILRSVEAVAQFVESVYLRRRGDADLVTVLVDRIVINDFLQAMAIFDEQGRLVASSHLLADTRLNIRDRDEFKVHVEGKGPKLYVGKTGPTPLSSDNAVPLTRRIEQADGSFGGVIMIIVRPGRFTEFYADAVIQPGDIFGLVGLDGIARVRKIYGRETFGENLAGNALMKAQPQQASGSVIGFGIVDGIRRHFAYRTVRDYPLIVYVGSAESEILADYMRRRTLYYGGAAAISLCMVLFAVFVILAVLRVTRIAAALAESEARFRALTELSADWWWEQDAEFRFVHAAGGKGSFSNIELKDFMGRRRWDAPNVKPVNTTWEAHQLLLEEHQPFTGLVMEYTNSNGTKHYNTAAGMPIFDAEGNFCGYRGVGREITATLQMERALRHSEARFRNLVELSSDWYWEQDEQFRFTFISYGHELAVDIDNLFCMGKTRWDIGIRDLSEEQWATHRRQLEAYQPFRQFEYRRLTSSGEEVYISISGDPVFDDDGRFTGYRGTGTDITARKYAEAEIIAMNAALEKRVRQRTEQLEATNQELRALGYSIAHDMRAPLRAIGGFSRMLVEHHLPEIDAGGNALFMRIQTNVEWMGQLIEGLLALSQLSIAPVTRKMIDLSQMSQEIVDELCKLEPARPVKLLLSEGLTIDGDEVMVRRMMQNLIGNAWKYTANEAIAKIEIGAHNGIDGLLTYFVKDNGVGFDMAYAGKLFQAFQRLHSHAEFVGTGIGLAIVSLVVRKHGGQIHAEAAVGKGASFHFTFRNEMAE